MTSRSANQPAPTPLVPEYFDYPSVANDPSGVLISSAQLRQIVHVFEVDYPGDVMLRELHILRACRAIKRGEVRLSDVIAGGNAAA